MKKIFVFLSSYLFISVALAAQVMLPGPSDLNNMINRSLSSENQEDMKDAIDFYKLILTKTPNDLYAINNIAKLYGKLGKFTEQITWAQKAIGIDAHNEAAYLNYGHGLLGLGKIAEAKNAYTKALELDANSSVAVYNLGLIADRENNQMTAIDFYKRTIELDPFYEKSYLNLARDYSSLQQYENAIATLNSLLMLRPDVQAAKDMLMDIQRIKIKK